MGLQRVSEDKKEFVHLWVCDKCFEAIYIDEYYEPFHICNPKMYVAATSLRKEEKKSKRKSLIKTLKDSIMGD